MVAFTTAKELQRSSFPYSLSEVYPLFVTSDTQSVDEHSANEMGYDYARIPLITDLISNCGDNVYLEYNVDLPSPDGLTKGCRALKIVKINGGPDVKVYTEIATELDEAVAKLWLMLKGQGIINT